jgi:hypothetical protein
VKNEGVQRLPQGRSGSFERDSRTSKGSHLDVSSPKMPARTGLCLVFWRLARDPHGREMVAVHEVG